MKLTVNKLLEYLESGYNKVYLDNSNTPLLICRDSIDKEYNFITLHSKRYIVSALVDKLNSFTTVEFSREVKETVVNNKPVLLELTEEELRELSKLLDTCNIEKKRSKIEQSIVDKVIEEVCKVL